MGKAEPKYIYDDSERVTTDQEAYEQLNHKVNCYRKIEYAPTRILKLYIERSEGKRYRYLFRLLIVIQGLDRPTKTMVINKMGIDKNAGCRNIDHLYDIGYLEKVGRKRLVLPYQKYITDTAYKLSPQGYSVLKQIMSKLFE